MAAILGHCDYCQEYTEVYPSDEEGLYICSECDERRIAELTEDWEMEPCTCRPTEPNCGHPLCRGCLT
jgi:hypothetical protein